MFPSPILGSSLQKPHGENTSKNVLASFPPHLPPRTPLPLPLPLPPRAPGARARLSGNELSPGTSDPFLGTPVTSPPRKFPEKAGAAPFATACELDVRRTGELVVLLRPLQRALLRLRP